MRSHPTLLPIFSLLLASLLLATSLCAQVEPEAPPGLLALTHVTVIDMTGAAPQRDMTVVITGDRITTIGPSAGVQVPKGARVIEARGKFLIPGLCDMHVHIVRHMAVYAPLLVAHGVTGVRDMHATGASLQELNRVRQLTAAGTLLGPRILAAAGHLIDGPGAQWPNSLRAADELQARQAVRTLKEAGADFVKVYNRLPRHAFYAVADEARRQRLPFAGHVPAAVTTAEASAAGQRSIEHLSLVILDCSSRSPELWNRYRELLTQLEASQPASNKIRGAALPLWYDAVNSYSGEVAARLFAEFAGNGTWQVPTLVQERFATEEGGKLKNDPRLKYVPAEVLKSWDTFPAPDAERINLNKLMYRRNYEMVGAMHRAGVPIMAGTDTGTTYPHIFAGFSLHDELGSLVKAGLTPMQALQAATRNPAQYLGRLDSSGTVEAGKVADLVLLDADPLQDISHTQRIHAVIIGGRPLDRNALDALLAQAEAATAQQK